VPPFESRPARTAPSTTGCVATHDAGTCRRIPGNIFIALSSIGFFRRRQDRPGAQRRFSEPRPVRIACHNSLERWCPKAAARSPARTIQGTSRPTNLPRTISAVPPQRPRPSGTKDILFFFRHCFFFSLMRIPSIDVCDPASTINAEDRAAGHHVTDAALTQKRTRRPESPAGIGFLATAAWTGGAPSARRCPAPASAQHVEHGKKHVEHGRLTTIELSAGAFTARSRHQIIANLVAWSPIRQRLCRATMKHVHKGDHDAARQLS